MVDASLTNEVERKSVIWEGTLLINDLLTFKKYTLLTGLQYLVSRRRVSIDC